MHLAKLTDQHLYGAILLLVMNLFVLQFHMKKTVSLCYQDETDFWNKLLERYLKPIQDDKAHLEEVTRELKSLRNKVRLANFGWKSLFWHIISYVKCELFSPFCVCRQCFCTS